MTSDDRKKKSAKIAALIRERQRNEYQKRKVKVPEHLSEQADLDIEIRIDTDEQRP